MGDWAAASWAAAARTLGATATETLWRVHLPLLRPALGAAALLVFVDAMKELPATLLLRPFNFDTLATQAYVLASDERLSEASSSALAIALGSSPRTVQRALDSLAATGKVQSFGLGRARRWMTPPVPGFPTTLLLPAPLPSV